MSAATQPKRILLVDGDEEFRDISIDALLEDGCEVAAVESGSRAIEMACAERFDVMVIDLRLPDMDGTEVVRRLQVSGKSIPTVVVSGCAGCLEASRLRKMGVERVLPKPVKIAVLIEKVRELSYTSARRDERVV